MQNQDFKKKCTKTKASGAANLNKKKALQYSQKVNLYSRETEYKQILFKNLFVKIAQSASFFSRLSEEL